MPGFRALNLEERGDNNNDEGIITPMLTCRPCVLALVLSCATASSRNQVTDLPGYGAPPSQHWSGFVEVDAADGANWFYYLVESEGSPTLDPLIWSAPGTKTEPAADPVSWRRTA